MQGKVAWAQFEMDPQELEIFLNSTDIDTPLVENQVPDDFTMVCKDAQNVLYGEHIEGPDRQRVAVNTDNPNLYIVCIERLYE